MADKTEYILSLAQTLKGSITDSYKHRFIPQSTIPTPEDHFIHETSVLYFSLKETEKQLETLRDVSKKSSLFSTHTQRIQQISDIVEDKIKVAKNKLEELKNVTMGNECGETIKQILQHRLFNLTQKYKQILNDRATVLKETSSRRSGYSFSSSLDFSSPSVPSFMEK
jgi:DNA-binding transcriptional MerR regulator